MDYTIISINKLCLSFKDNWKIQYKLPTVDIWLDYDIYESTLVSFLALCGLNAEWRYKY